MSESLYELLALFARYIFAGLMVLIVVRAWRITIVDSRRAKTLRRISPQTGIIGEMMVLEGSEKARRGMKYKVIREGQIGSSRRADIRIRHSSVRRRHAYFLLTEEGLKIRAHAGAPLRDEHGRTAREMILRDGDSIDVGRVQLMLILSQAAGPESFRSGRRSLRRSDAPDNDSIPETEDDLFDPEDDLFDPFPTPSSRDHNRPTRRHLPFSMEDMSSAGDPAFRRHADSGIRRSKTPSDDLHPGIRRSGSDGFTSGYTPVADNPLNAHRAQQGRVHPRNVNPADFDNDDEMW